MGVQKIIQKWLVWAIFFFFFFFLVTNRGCKPTAPPLGASTGQDFLLQINSLCKLADAVSAQKFQRKHQYFAQERLCTIRCHFQMYFALWYLLKWYNPNQIALICNSWHSFSDTMEEGDMMPSHGDMHSAKHLL